MNIRQLFIIPIALLAVSTFSGCKKDHRILANDVLPIEDEFNALKLENIAVSGYSKAYTNIVSLNTDQKYIGDNADGMTGKLEIGLYTNANLTSDNVFFSDSVQLKSAEIVLVISNTNIIGDKRSVLNYSVFPLDSTLKSTRAYYTNNTVLHNANKVVGGATTAYDVLNGKLVVRIPMDSIYSRDLMKNTAALATNESFKSNYKGFYITATSTSGDGIIYTTNLGDELSGYHLRYRKNLNDTIDRDYRIRFSGDDAARFNTVKFTAVPGLNAQFSGDTAQGGNTIYLKGMGASKAIVRVPFLKNYNDTFKVAVSRAELIFNLDPSIFSKISGADTNVIYRVPEKLALLALDSLGREILTRDQYSATYISRYDGNYDANNKRYVFNIPLHAQSILNGKTKNYGFTIVVADPDPLTVAFRDQSFTGVLLQGENGLLKPTLNMTYIRLTNE